MLLGLARVARPGRRPSLTSTPWRRTLPLLAAALAMAAAPPPADVLTPRSRARGALFGALVGDALSLGGQYEYDAKVIASKVGSYTEFHAPTVNYGVGWGRANYHPGKVAGDLTDAGDVALFLLEYLATLPAGEGFHNVGRDATECPPGTIPGYLNGGTRRTLEALRSFPGAVGEKRKALAADVNCLVSATHWVPLLSMPGYDTEAKFVADAVSTVYLSHKNRDPVAAAAFLSRAAWRIAHNGASLVDALSSADVDTGDAFISARLAEAVAKVAEAAEGSGSPLSLQGRFTDDVAITSLARLWDVGKEEPIKVGKASPTEGALPASLYFVLRYAHSLEEALIANANCGGDSSARAIVIGTLLGASRGEGAVPPRWSASLNAAKRANEWLARVEARGGAAAGVAGEAGGGGGGEEL